MRHQHHSRSASTVPRMEASWIAGLISNLDRHAELLDQDIAAAEPGLQVFNATSPAVTLLAGGLVAALIVGASVPSPSREESAWGLAC